jgi:hypothetical protein
MSWDLAARIAPILAIVLCGWLSYRYIPFQGSSICISGWQSTHLTVSHSGRA